MRVRGRDMDSIINSTKRVMEMDSIIDSKKRAIEMDSIIDSKKNGEEMDSFTDLNQSWALQWQRRNFSAPCLSWITPELPPFE